MRVGCCKHQRKWRSTKRKWLTVEHLTCNVSSKLECQLAVSVQNRGNHLQKFISLLLNGCASDGGKKKYRAFIRVMWIFAAHASTSNKQVSRHLLYLAVLCQVRDWMKLGAGEVGVRKNSCRKAKGAVSQFWWHVTKTVQIGTLSKSGMEETSLLKPPPKNQETVFARSLPF